MLRNPNFSVKNISGATYSWTTSSGLEVVSGGSTSTATIGYVGVEENAWVEVSINTSCAPNAATRRVYLTAGFPSLYGPYATPDGADTAYPNSHYTYYMHYPFGYPTPSFYWEVPSGWTILMGQGTNAVYVKTGGMGSGGPVEVDITACGITKPVYKYVEIGYGSDWPDAIPPEESRSAGTKLGVSPNPANDRVILSLIKSNAGKENRIASIQSIRVTDKMGTVKKMVSVPAGQYSYTLNVSDLPRDVYIVSVFDGVNWYNSTLLVK